MSDLPPLALLQTIEAVARFKSFKRAAEAMHVTPSAVSHRIRLVEEQLGRQLFIREGKGIRPTKNAETLAKAVAEAEANIAKAWSDVSKDVETKMIRVSCMAAFAEQFILPHLEEFKRKFPHFHLDSTNVTYAEDGNRQGYDILIGIGPRPGDDWQCDDIHQLFVRPILSKSLQNLAFRDRTLFGPLLGTTVNVIAWDTVASSLGYEIHASAKTVKFDSILSMCSAAERGVGIALAPFWVAEKLLQSGSVYALGDHALKTEFAYWFATRKDQKLSSVHDRFQRWLRSKLVQPSDK